MPAPRLALFLNPWGASSFSRHLPTLLAEARRHGYDGVEMSLSDLGPDAAARRATCDMISDHGMRLILGLYSGWDDYAGPWAPSSPGAHVAQLEQQLKQAERLGPVVTHVNVHSPEARRTRFQKLFSQTDAWRAHSYLCPCLTRQLVPTRVSLHSSPPKLIAYARQRLWPSATATTSTLRALRSSSNPCAPSTQITSKPHPPVPLGPHSSTTARPRCQNSAGACRCKE